MLLECFLPLHRLTCSALEAHQVHESPTWLASWPALLPGTHLQAHGLGRVAWASAAHSAANAAQGAQNVSFGYAEAYCCNYIDTIERGGVCR